MISGPELSSSAVSAEPEPGGRLYTVRVQNCGDAIVLVLRHRRAIRLLDLEVGVTASSSSMFVRNVNPLSVFKGMISVLSLLLTST